MVQAVGPPAAGGFLASGGLPTTPLPPTTVAGARSGTSSFIVDTVNPKTYTWSLGVQHEFTKDWVVETRYVGTRGVSLPIQTRRSGGVPIPVDRRLPTYMNASEIPANGAALPSLANILNYPGSGTLVLENLGFDGGFITAFDPIGNSIYHGGSIDVQRRAAKGLYFRGGYTWSKVIDDSTNELFSSRVNPRRAEDFFDIRNERGNSALNRTHHFTLAWTYELPRFSGSNAFMSKVLGGWQINGIYLQNPVSRSRRRAEETSTIISIRRVTGFSSTPMEIPTWDPTQTSSVVIQSPGPPRLQQPTPVLPTRLVMWRSTRMPSGLLRASEALATPAVT